ncbi:MAG: DUF3343 domain-containing protein [Clostridia bacterium]|nr:DUF3343 domain-containing protein [Clostridia bacterium]
MEYVIVAYRSRTHTVRFHEYLDRVGIPNEIVNTPKEAGVGCGLSVKVPFAKLNLVKRAVAFSNLNSFAGFFLVKHIAKKKTVRALFN